MLRCHALAVAGVRRAAVDRSTTRIGTPMWRVLTLLPGNQEFELCRAATPQALAELVRILAEHRDGEQPRLVIEHILLTEVQQ